MISIKELTESDKGKMVVYVPEGNTKVEQGVITSWNGYYVFVRYQGDIGSKATRPEDLNWAFK